jgi:DNA-binding NtrC family response regulator
MWTRDDIRGDLTVLILALPQQSSRVLERNLGEMGFDVLVSTDLEEAPGVLQHPSGIDVVLTDTVLAWGTWLDALDLVEELAPGSPIVVCSSEHSPALRDQVRECGAYYAEMEPYHPIAVQLLIHPWVEDGLTDAVRFAPSCHRAVGPLECVREDAN